MFKWFTFWFACLATVICLTTATYHIAQENLWWWGFMCALSALNVAQAVKIAKHEL